MDQNLAPIPLPALHSLDSMLKKLPPLKPVADHTSIGIDENAIADEENVPIEETTPEEALPELRKNLYILLPLGYGLVVGFGCLLVIAATAANLGPKSTDLWLLSAAGSLVIKVFVVDPLKVVALTVLVQCAEHCENRVLL
jgi:hypothetical protein